MQEAEEFKTLIMDPMIAGIRAELKPVADLAKAHEARIARLESTNRKAMIGWGAIMAAGTLVWNYATGKARGGSK